MWLRSLTPSRGCSHSSVRLVCTLHSTLLTPPAGCKLCSLILGFQAKSRQLLAGAHIMNERHTWRLGGPFSPCIVPTVWLCRGPIEE
uniref:Uncharacterized protein n=1 Tax=Rhipicephalus appendiculatus TaxID=34631 RepID=A0A131YNS0_RHIAP